MTRARRFLSQAARHQAAAAARSVYYAGLAFFAGFWGALIAFGIFGNNWGYDAIIAIAGACTGFSAAAILKFGGAKWIDRGLSQARTLCALASSLLGGAAALRIRIFDALAAAASIFARAAAIAAGAALALTTTLARALHARARAHARIVVLARTTTRTLSITGAR